MEWVNPNLNPNPNPNPSPNPNPNQVLTMEWVDGARLTSLTCDPTDEACDVDKATYIVDTLVQCTLRQMLRNGFFHADPHMGNLLVTAQGELTYLDFGMMSFLEPTQRFAIIEAAVHPNPNPAPRTYP